MPRYPSPKHFFIISLDIVEYTKKSELEQLQLFRRFQREVHHVLYDEIADDECILIPTGDGMIVGLENTDPENTYVRSFDLVAAMIKWTNANSCQLRTSIHIGDVNVLTDINRRSNLVGSTINDATRILGGADKGAIIISKVFLEKFFTVDAIHIGAELPVTDQYVVKIVDEDSIVDKHNKVHKVYSVALSDQEAEYGTRTKIASRYSARVYSTDYPKIENMKKEFSHRVRNASRIVFIGIFNPSVLEVIEQLREELRERVTIDIHFAADNLESTLQTFFGSVNESTQLTTKQASMKAITNWHQNHPCRELIELRMHEYSSMLPLGASMVDFDISGSGFIHVSNYLPGVLPSKTPYMEIDWRTESIPPLYQFYRDYLIDLSRQHRRIV